jgi:hypothetical protein
MRFRGVAWIGLSLLSAGLAHAQELEPRAYSPSPIGTTFVLSGVGGSEGGILFDPSLDIANFEADLWIATPASATLSAWRDGRLNLSIANC